MFSVYLFCFINITSSIILAIKGRDPIAIGFSFITLVLFGRINEDLVGTSTNTHLLAYATIFLTMVSSLSIIYVYRRDIIPEGWLSTYSSFIRKYFSFFK